jgi:hypothetical protein
VFGGPPRFSDYQLLVFLLTDEGVRQVSISLDFTTGVISNEQRLNFHYAAVAAARVSEMGVRIEPDGETRETQIAARPHELRPELTHALVLSRTFKLSLVNGESVQVMVENFDEGLVDRLEDNPQSILELALDAAGVTGALGVLEAVAAEGRTWIERERNRRKRRSHLLRNNGLHHGERGQDPENGRIPENGHRSEVTTPAQRGRSFGSA